MSNFWDNVAHTLQLAPELKECFEHGQRIVNLAFGDAGVMGRLLRTSDAFAYYVTLCPNGTFLFQLTQLTLWTDFDLYIVNTDGEVIASATTNENSSVVQVNGNGACYAIVVSASGAGKYRLMLEQL